MIRLRPALVLCLLAIPFSQGLATERPQAESALDAAVEEFKIQTEQLGLRTVRLRVDAPPVAAPRPVWRGRLYHHVRNDIFDAVPHEVRQGGQDHRTLRRNQFGFNVSGPLIIPKVYDGRGRTFFSLSYEGLRERIGRSMLQTIPTLPERIGDWSATVDRAGNLLPIYDPASTRLNPHFDPDRPVSLDNLQYRRDPFPGNQIPQHRLDPVAAKALGMYPAPNVSIGPFFRNNFFILAMATELANGFIASVDHNVGERHRFGVVIAASDGFTGPAHWFPTPANPGPVDQDYFSRRASFEYVFTVSPRTIHSASFNVDMRKTEGGDLSRADYGRQLGLQGISDWAFPYFDVDDYLDMGRTRPLSKDADIRYTWANSLSTRQGKHHLRAGVSYMYHHQNTLLPAQPSGRFRFTPGITSLPGIVNTGHGFASFTLGLADLAEVTMFESPSYYRRTFTSWFLQNRYDPFPNLSLTMGLNIDHRTPRIEKFDRQSNIDLKATNPENGRPGALVAAGTGGWGRAFSPSLLRAVPTAGVAWSLAEGGRTVVRFGYDRSYRGVPLHSGQWGTQGFTGTPTFVSPNVQLEPALRLFEGVPPPKHPLPDLRPEAANHTFADLTDTSKRTSVTQSGRLSIEREFLASTLVTAGVYRSTGSNLFVGNRAVNVNAIPLEALEHRDALLNEEFNRSLRPYPQYLGFNLNNYWPEGRYKRDAGFLRVEKRATRGLTANAQYEFGKQMDDYSGPFGLQDPHSKRNEWSLTAGQPLHEITLNYSYELPLGPNRMFLSRAGWRRHLAAGWTLSGGSTWRSGDPIALHPRSNNTGGVVQALRVNVVPGVDPHVSKPTPERWFNPAAFDQPADFTIGNASRTHPTLRNPGFQNHDLSARKRFLLTPGHTLEFSAVALNFINTANWNNPEAEIGPLHAPNVDAGRIIGSRGGRIMQMGLTLSF